VKRIRTAFESDIDFSKIRKRKTSTPGRRKIPEIVPGMLKNCPKLDTLEGGANIISSVQNMKRKSEQPSQDSQIGSNDGLEDSSAW
jgi:hypothetical protein